MSREKIVFTRRYAFNTITALIYPLQPINEQYKYVQLPPFNLRTSSLKRSLLFSAVLYAVPPTSIHAAQPIAESGFVSDIVNRHADHIFYNNGATGVVLVVIGDNQRVLRSYGETQPGNNVRPQLDSVMRIASLTKLMTSEMLVKLLDQGTMKLNDPLNKYAPPGARVPAYNGMPVALVNLTTHTSVLPREQPGGAAYRPVFIWPVHE